MMSSRKVVLVGYVRTTKETLGPGLVEDRNNVRPPIIVQHRIPRRVSIKIPDSAGIGCKVELNLSPLPSR